MLPVPAGNMGVAGSIQSNLLNFSPVLGGRVFLSGGQKAGLWALAKDLARDLLVFDPVKQQVHSSVDLDDHDL